MLWYIDTHNHEDNMRDEDRDAVPLSMARLPAGAAESLGLDAVLSVGGCR